MCIIVEGILVLLTLVTCGGIGWLFFVS